MTLALLTWHGSLLTVNSGFIEAVALPAVDPENTVLLELEEGRLCNCPENLHLEGRVVEGDNARLMTLGCGHRFLRALGPSQLDWVEHAFGWEHFLALDREVIFSVREILAQKWVLPDSLHCVPVLHELHLCIGDHRWPLEQLRVAGKSDCLNIVTSEGTEYQFRMYPSGKMSQTLEKTNAWISSIEDEQVIAELKQQIVEVVTLSRSSGPLLIMSRCCAELGNVPLAEAWLACTREFDTRADLIFFESILAAKYDLEKSNGLLCEALKKRFPDDDIEKQFFHLLKRGDAGENILLLLQAWLQKLKNCEFDHLFEQIIVPQKISSDNAADIIESYSQSFEEKSGRLTSAQRERLVQVDQSINGRRYWSEICQGHNSWLSGDRVTADRHYASARQLAITEKIMPIHYNCGVFSWLGETRTLSLETSRVEDRLGFESWCWHHSHFDKILSSQVELCFVVGCDVGYFRFIPKLFLSLLTVCEARKGGARIRLCIGVDSPNSDHLSFLHEIIKVLSENDYGLDVSFTHGTLTYRDGATYTAIRYLMLPHVTSNWHSPVITADADGYFPENFAALWEGMRDSYDYGFRLYAYDKSGKQVFGEPWGFGAGISYFGDVDVVAEIGRFLHNYLQVAYDPANPTNWCIDQCALVQAYRRFVGPHWNGLHIKFMDEGEPLMVMPHHVGGKDELLQHGGHVSMADVRAYFNAQA